MPGPGPFFGLRSLCTAISVISTLCLMITFTALLQCGQRVENEASELKTASLKMILVQCGQLPMFSSLSIVVFPEGVCCQPDLYVSVRLAIEAQTSKNGSCAIRAPASDILDHS